MFSSAVAPHAGQVIVDSVQRALGVTSTISGCCGFIAALT